jgi:hypothetical protein
MNRPILLSNHAMIVGNMPRSGVSACLTQRFGHDEEGVIHTTNSRCWSFDSPLFSLRFGFPRHFGGQFVTLRVKVLKTVIQPSVLQR